MKFGMDVMPLKATVKLCFFSFLQSGKPTWRTNESEGEPTLVSQYGHVMKSGSRFPKKSLNLVL